MNRSLCVLAAMCTLLGARLEAQTLSCLQPPAGAPTEPACRANSSPGAKDLIFVLQLRGPDDKTLGDVLVQLSASTGTIPDTARTDARGIFYIPWKGTVGSDPIVVTAVARKDGWTTSRQIRIGPSDPESPPPYITSIAPTGGHSAFAGRYLNDDIEVQIDANPATCIRTTVVFEYLSVGTGGTPAPTRTETPALWNELDPNRFGCAAQLRWVLSPAVGDQMLRAWIKRDSTFSIPADPAGAQKYVRPYTVHAVAHATPAFLVGAAVIDSGGAGGVPRLVGVDLPFPTLADLLKHGGLRGPGEFVDRLRFFAATDFNAEGKQRNLYLGLEPLVFLIGPRAADLPVAFAAGRRTGMGKDRWFGSLLVNAGQVAALVAQGIGIK